MEYIKLKLKLIDQLYEHIKNYYEKIHVVINNKYDLENITKYFNREIENKNIEKIINKIENEDLINTNKNNIKIHLNKLLKDNEIYDDIFYLYSLLQYYNNNIELLIHTLNTKKYNIDYMSDINVSQTFQIEINDDLNILKNMYKSYNKKNKLNDKNIINYLTNIIVIIFKVKNNNIFLEYENITETKNYFKLDEDLYNSILEIRNYFIKNNETIELYINIINKYKK